MDCKGGSQETSAVSHTGTTSATQILRTESPEEPRQIGGLEDTRSDSDSDNSTGDHSEDGWNVDDDDGTPDEERPVWVYVNYSPRCCESGAEGVDVAVLAEGVSTLTLNIPRSLAHVRARVHDAEDFWRRYLREDLLKLCTHRQARVLIASVGCLQHFANMQDSDDLASLWSEFENVLDGVVSCSIRFPLGERKENLLHPVLLWAMNRCQDALLLPARWLPPGESYVNVLEL